MEGRRDDLEVSDCEPSHGRQALFADREDGLRWLGPFLPAGICLAVSLAMPVRSLLVGATEFAA
jgi:hypothetical protein